MFEIKYKIVTENFNDINNITDEYIQYKFLLGSVSICMINDKIPMDWEWIPLLDFAYSLRNIVSLLKETKNDIEYFEFTESNETLNFAKFQNLIKITTSFSSIELIVSSEVFESEIILFHSRISNYVRRHVPNYIPENLEKYLQPLEML